jgi:hypothetical protein
VVPLIYLVAASGSDAALLFGRVALIIGFQAFVVLLTCLSIAMGGNGQDDSGPDDEGPGWGRPEPRQPPPEPHMSWPDFERQFAEHVEGIRARDKVPAA